MSDQVVRTDGNDQESHVSLLAHAVLHEGLFCAHEYVESSEGVR